MLGRDCNAQSNARVGVRARLHRVVCLAVHEAVCCDADTLSGRKSCQRMTVR